MVTGRSYINLVLMKYKIGIQQCNGFLNGWEGRGVNRVIIISHDQNNILQFKTIIYNFIQIICEY